MKHGLIRTAGLAYALHRDTASAAEKPDEKIAVRYAEEVTKDATKVNDEIFEELKKYYNDAQIVEITAAISLFNYINRFNDSLHIIPEP